ncbi:MAG: hypothetical protein JWQ40_3621 [Segetibacter sp.]|nr:hypothetical protein [Segetibacter sp.]
MYSTLQYSGSKVIKKFVAKKLQVSTEKVKLWNKIIEIYKFNIRKRWRLNQLFLLVLYLTCFL